MFQSIVFHGRENHIKATENIVFFSSSADFSKDYGIVKRYNLTMQNPFDTCSETDINNLLDRVSTLVDSYDDSEYESFNELQDSGLLYTDTWEVFEPHIQQIKALGYDGMIIYEGGVQNYVSFQATQYSVIHDEITDTI